jgi:photosystem II stability/assembly factor-like uncharacterized protein
MATWVKSNAPSLNWSKVASSSDGTKLVAVNQGGYIYTSADSSGATWTIRTSSGSRNWVSVSSSSDGTKLVAGTDGGYLYNSTNSGVTWTEQTNSGIRSWNSNACDSTGQIVYAAASGNGIYKSTNYGATWTKTSAPGSNWTAISCNSSGTFIVAVAPYSYIYTSSDSGSTWTQQTGSSSGVNWYGVACNSTGSKIVACVIVGYIYTSTNYGVNWTQTSSPSLRWRYVASSSDGSRLYAVTDGTDGYIYLSTNSGSTWTQMPSSGPGGPGLSWYSVATSSDGYFAVAVLPPYTGSYSGIYIYKDTAPSPNPPCFKEGTKILTMKGYKLVQDLRKGDMVKTLRNDYKAIEMIGKKEFIHRPTPEDRVKEQLYVCSKPEFDQILEPLVLTGCHSILVDKFVSEAQRQKTIDVNGNIYLTDNKYRLPACAHHGTTVYETPGTYMIYHLALENEDYYMNYGIYANGLLVESCSRRYLKERSNMELIE